MNKLVYLKNDEAVCDSLLVAEKFGKRHADVLEKIEKILSDEPTENSVRCFKKTSYRDAKGEIRPMYLMNRDGFTFLVMGFTGKKANEWKWNYINAFNSMETILRERSTEVWLETRQQGKLTRKAETDVIQQLIKYAKEQGSTHADMLYITYSKLSNKMAGIKKRDEATVSQLNNLSLMENIILNCIQNGIMLEKHYKVIYQDCKRRLEAFKDIAYLETAS
ncbi:transcriptional regulator [Acetivibrio ethanolgignens]|uniref:Transcriptional regulator n=1 Tax=Acetivibrio ethanolgignens TaxID=290052 RepID=A0A0V8QIX1_9FIRM|nr:transcriptional regulator [Acetivibrio ethanolgignens]